MTRRPTISPWRNAGKTSETAGTADDVVRETGWVFNNETGEHLTLAEFVDSGWHEVGWYFSHLDLFWAQPGDRSMVEIGSGIGRMTASLTKLFAHVVACDLDAAFLERCRETVAAHGQVSRLSTVHVADGHSLAIPDNSHDLVFSYITLQHCKGSDALELVAEALRVAKPGGKVALNFRTWTPQDVALVPVGTLVRGIWRVVPRLSKAPRLVTRFGWQANRLSPSDVLPIVNRHAPNAASIEVYQAERRRGVMKSPVRPKRLGGAHPSHWWLVVTK